MIPSGLTADGNPAEAGSPPGRAPPPRRRAPAWRLPFHVLRSALTLLGTLIVSLGCDVWVRAGVLFRFRKDEAKRIAAMNRVVRFWGVCVSRINRLGLGVRISVEGDRPATGRYLILANHQSSVDIPLLIWVFRGLNLKFVAWEELRRWKPGVSVTLRHGGFAFVAKRDLGSDLVELHAFGARLEKHLGSAVMFPEGRRSDDGLMLPFQLAGAESVRRTARLPLLPVTIDGLSEARTIRRLHRVVGSEIKVVISDPIPFEDTEDDPRAAFRRVERIVRGSLDRIRSRTPR